MVSYNRILGKSLNDVIVIGEEGIINKHGLHDQDELFKHKIRDAVGDLFVLNHKIIGTFHGNKSANYLNNRLLRKLWDSPASWKTGSFNGDSQLPINFIQSNIGWTLNC